MKKKLLFFVMTFFVVCLLTVCVSAVEVDGIHYTFKTTDAYPGYDGTATVNTENRTSGTLTNVVIPEIVEYDSDDDGVVDKKYVVTEVASEAFGKNGTTNSPVVSVFIPKTVKSIGAHVFRGCPNLETVTIEARGYNPSTGEDYTAEVKLSNAEFYQCYKLTSVDMSKSNVVETNNYCFHYCSELHTVLFSKNIKKINSSFRNNGKLTTISSIETLTSIDGGFYGSKISGDIKLPNLTHFEGQAFRGTNITSVDLSGSSITSLPSYAFAECYSLTSAIIPNEISSIGSNAFQNCSKLTSVNITDNLKTVGGSAFEGCSALVGVVVPNTLTSIGDKGFYGANVSGDLVLNNVTYIGESALRGTKITSVDISSCTNLTEIKAYAFAHNGNLTTVKLPDTITAFREGAFNGCSGLTSININRNVTVIENSAFWGPKFGGDLVFDTIVTFGTHALRETNITSLVILNGTIKGENGAADKVLTSLNTNASLYGCTKLEILVLPETVTTAGSNTFTNCNSLKYIVASENFTSISSKPAKADIIIRGTDTTALQNTWTGYTVAPFSEFDPATAGTKTIYYGAVNAKDSTTTFVEFDAFDKEFSSWDATTNTETTYAPIFEAQGYSTNNEKNAIATGFSVTKASLDAYKSLIGDEVNFGIVIFNPKYLSDGSFFTTNEDGAILNASGGFLMVDVGTEYSNCSLSVQGFNSGNSGIELVFAGFAYTDDITRADIFQKEYIGTSESPIASPMVSKVTRSEGTLYTTTIASVCTPVEITTGKDGLGEYTA